MSKSGQVVAGDSLSWTQADDRMADARFFAERADELDAFVRGHEADLAAYISACEDKGFLPDDEAYGVSEQIMAQMREGIGRMRAMLVGHVPEGAAYYRYIVQLERLYRSLLLLKVPAVRVMSWGSAAYDQSLDTFHFYGSQYGSLGERLNYDRIDGPHVARWRTQMKGVLGAEGHGLVALASGTAAFTLLMTYLMQDVFERGFTLYVPRVVYGETDLMLREHGQHYTLRLGDDDSCDTIYAAIVDDGVEVVLLEGMRNALGNPLLDVQGLVRRLNDVVLNHDVYLVVDDTLLTGAYVLLDLVTNPRVKVYQYFSMLKYAQLGMDAGFSAALIVPQRDEVVFRKRASLLGLVLYDSVALTYPQFDRTQFVRRQQRMTHNALLMARILRERLAGRGAEALYPLMEGHPDREQAKALPFVGCLVTLDVRACLPDVYDGNLVPLFDLLNAMVDMARREGLSLAMRESFGMGAAAVIVPWCKRTKPYIRISAGDRSLEETTAIAHVIADALVARLR